ncbi:MAG: flagellar assembly protein FliH [Gammaproteobacteria bacterium]|nr:flagellar assembly protein FliH [Gammaproteobacteria bacterium]
MSMHSAEAVASEQSVTMTEGFGPGNGVVTPYELPDIEQILVRNSANGAGVVTARELESIHKQAYAEGFENGTMEGYADGQRRAAADIEARCEVLDNITMQLIAPLAKLDEEMVNSVAELALLIARHLVRRELKTAPGEVIGVVRETMRLLPIASRGTTLHLNPDDAELVRSALSIDTDGISWRVEADPLISRGGCIVETETSRIDATVESRIAAIASKMFGGERESDRGAA